MEPKIKIWLNFEFFIHALYLSFDDCYLFPIWRFCRIYYIHTRIFFFSFWWSAHLIPEALSEFPDPSPTAFTPDKTGKNQKEDDTAVLKRHLTGVNLLFVRHFKYQTKEICSSFRFWRYIFNLRLRERDIARDPSLGSVLIKNALLISRNRSEKK